jgi:hypothetical protein
VTSPVDGEAGSGSGGQYGPAQCVVGLVVECGPGGEAQVGVRPFNGAIGANPDPVIGRSVETGGTMRNPHRIGVVAYAIQLPARP